MTTRQAALLAYRDWCREVRRRRLLFLKQLVEDGRVSDWGDGWRDERLPPERC